MVIHEARRRATEHARLYNGSEVSEVFAIIPGAEDGIIGRRHFVFKRRETPSSVGDGVFEEIPVTNRSRDPHIYFQLLPFGEEGWHFRVPPSEIARDNQPMQTNRFTTRCQRATPTMFYCYRLYTRLNELIILQRGGKLFQLCIVDQYCKVESERLSFLRQNQQKIVQQITLLFASSL